VAATKTTRRARAPLLFFVRASAPRAAADPSAPRGAFGRARALPRHGG
jgi:hypothetical protein